MAATVKLPKVDRSPKVDRKQTWVMKINCDKNKPSFQVVYCTTEFLQIK